MYNKKPKLRFKGFTDDWEQRKLGDCIDDLKSGLSRMLSEEDIGLPVVRANNIEDDKLDLKNEIKYWYKEDPQGADTNNYLIHKNDILINFINSESKMGTAAIVETEPNRRTIYTTNILRMRVNEKCNNYFFLSQTHTKSYIEFIKGISKIAVNQASFTTVDFKNYSIYLPIIDEQNKIGKLFKEIDNLITLYQCKYDKLLNIKKSLFEKMFPKNGSNTPEIRFKGYTDAWEQRKLGEIGTTYTGLSGKTKEDFGHGSGKFVSYMNVFTNPISNTEKLEQIEKDNSQNKVIYGDVFFTTSSETPDEVGMSSVWLGNTEDVYLNSFCFGYRPNEKIDPYYMAYMLRSNEVRRKIIVLAQGISRYNISKMGMMEIQIPLPSLLEQKQVGKTFYDLDNLITLHQRKYETLKNIKQSLLEKMFI